MTESKKLYNGSWRKPHLTVHGQQTFWSEQANGYEKKGMTNDNRCEMNAVLAKCSELQLERIITLGGANGCRDPKLIMDDIHARKVRKKPEIFFNDLAPSMVNAAETTMLAPFIKKGFKITYRAGEIRHVCQNLPPVNRRLLVGVYDAGSFFHAHPDEYHPRSGFDGYVRERAVIGNHLFFEWVRLNEENKFVTCGLRASVDTEGKKEDIVCVRRMLSGIESEIYRGTIRNVGALQVIGRSEGRRGFFLSHWYTPYGMSRMIKTVFPPSRFRVAQFHFAKGTVYSIDPRGVRPTEVVTILNNVLGNVLPDQQYETLLAVRDIVTRKHID